MTFKIFGRNIAAVSLIEIMMIFTIIGIVTLACANLSKPKYEYMKKIKLYTALSELEAAAGMIAKEGHLDYTTDTNVCSARYRAHQTYDNVCKDYEGQFPAQSSQLPKVSMRDAVAVPDIGIETTIYANLTEKEKEQFKYLQGGLCQRLGHIFNVPSTSVNCATTTSASGLISESNSTYTKKLTYPTDFTIYQPQLYLANGQVVYIGRNTYNDFRVNGVTYTTMVSSENSGSMREEVIADKAKLASVCDDYYETLLGLRESHSDLLQNPNETRLKLATDFSDVCAGFISHEYSRYFKLLQDTWAKNKDYFIVYVDIDCKKTSDNDKQCGNDRLNEDVFAFRMYRDGSVVPDYVSGFPQDALTAKVLVKDRDDMYGRFRSPSNYAYANKPLNFAKCYANISGKYFEDSLSDKYNELSGMCTFNGTTIEPLDDCIMNDESVCRAILNKPSFIMR